MSNIKVDTKGLDCPLPLIKLKEVLAKSEEGQIIELEFTCPEAVINIPKYCQENNYEVIEFNVLDNKSWKIVVKK